MVMFFHGGTAISVNPDIVCLPNGVTSMVDAGSSGWVNYQLFRNSVIHPAMVKIKSYLNVVNVGLSTLGGGPTGYLENTNPANYNEEKIAQTLNSNRDNILGLKLRYSQDIAKGETVRQRPSSLYRLPWRVNWIPRFAFTSRTLSLRR